jgi:hypothetical protein
MSAGRAGTSGVQDRNLRDKRSLGLRRRGVEGLLRYAEGVRPPVDRGHVQQPDLFGAGRPAVANGVVYFSSANGGTYGYDAAGTLDCSVSGSAKTCSPLWGAVSGFIGGGSPAIVNGVLYINVAGNGTLYAYSPAA